jgi:hypothetical protein
MNLKNKLTFFLIFFPFLGFIPGIDVQPFFLIFSLSTFLFFSLRNKFKRKDVILFPLCIVLFLAFALFNDFDKVTIAKGIASILTPFLITHAINDGLKITEKQIIIFCLIIFSVGLIQLFFNREFLTILVSRSSDAIQRSIETGRGVRSVFPEPATFGKQILLTNILIYSLLISKKKNKLAKQYSILFFVLNILLSQSIYSIGIHFIFILIFIISFKQKLFLLILIPSLLLVLNTSYVNDFLSENSNYRAFKLLFRLLDNPSILMNQGAFGRLYNMKISLNNFIEFNYTGSQSIEFSNPNYTYIDTLFGKYDYRLHQRNYGGAIEYLLMYGFYSIPIFIFIFQKYLGVFKSNKQYVLLTSFSLFLLFQDGSTSNPFTWFVFIYLTTIFNDKFLHKAKNIL